MSEDSTPPRMSLYAPLKRVVMPDYVKDLPVPEYDDDDPTTLIDADWRWRRWMAPALPPSPGARVSHSITATSRKTLILCGGGVCDPQTMRWTHYNDLHEFDLATAQWSKICAKNASYFTARRGHAAAFCPRRRLLIVVGGTNGGVDDDEEALRSDVAVFDLDSREWRTPPVGAAADDPHAQPTARRGAVAWLDSAADAMFVFGGLLSDADDSSDRKVHRLDLSRSPWEWSSIGTSGGRVWELRTTRRTTGVGDEALAAEAEELVEIPPSEVLQIAVSARRRAAELTDLRADDHRLARARRLLTRVPVCTVGAVIGRELWTVGGCVMNEFGCDSNVRVLDLDTWKWSLIISTGTAGAPAPRMFHSVCAVGRALVVFGGSNSAVRPTETLGDLHVFDTVRRRWRAPRVARDTAPPCARNGHVLASLGRACVLFGGGVYPSRYFGDSAVLEIVDPPLRAPPRAPLAPRSGLFPGAAPADLQLVAADGTGVAAERSVLLANSPYFRAMLEGDRFAETDASQIRLPDVDAATLSAAVRFLHTGELDVLGAAAEAGAAASGELAVRLLQLSEMWDTPALGEYVEDALADAMEGGAINALDLLSVACAHERPRLRLRSLVHARRNWTELRHASAPGTERHSFEVLRELDAFSASFL